MGAGEVQVEYKAKVLPHKDSEAVEQVPLRGCVTSALGGFQAPTSPSCEKPRAGPALGRELD